MRDIEFRGLNDKNEWCYGTYHYSNDDKHHYILNKEKFLDRVNTNAKVLHSTEVHSVLKHTVGQFTGLLDQNCDKIYEGDIMETQTGRVVKVIYQDGMFKMILLNNLGFGVSLVTNHLQSVIIGNIYDKAWEEKIKEKVKEAQF